MNFITITAIIVLHLESVKCSQIPYYLNYYYDHHFPLSSICPKQINAATFRLPCYHLLLKSAFPKDTKANLETKISPNFGFAFTSNIESNFRLAISSKWTFTLVFESHLYF